MEQHVLLTDRMGPSPPGHVKTHDGKRFDLIFLFFFNASEPHVNIPDHPIPQPTFFARKVCALEF